MRTLLICHHDARIAREVRRVGWWRFLDVLAFRAYYALVHRRGDREWTGRELHRLRTSWPKHATPPELIAPSPNGRDVEQFINERRPDLVIARCKSLIEERIFTIPRLGTLVMHPGICPEYRNAHGCFWALANGDWANVGMTLLKIDAGVDTGPVFGYFRCDFDEARESHVVIQERAVFDNLDALEAGFREILAGRALAID